MGCAETGSPPALTRGLFVSAAAYCGQWDEQKKIPKEALMKAYKAGLLPAVVGKWNTECVI